MDAIANSSFSAIPASLAQRGSASQENKKSIESLPTQRWEQFLEEINKNEKDNDIKLSELTDLGLEFFPDSLINLDLQKSDAGKIYNTLIANEALPPVLLYSVLDFFVREKGLDLKAPLSLPADIAKRKNTQPVKFPPSMATSSTEKEHSKILRNFQADNVSKLKARICELPAEELGDLIIELVEEKSVALRNSVCFQVLISRLEDISDENVSLILQLIVEYGIKVDEKDRGHIFNMFEERVDYFSGRKRELLLIVLASVVYYKESNRVGIIPFFVEKMDVTTNDANAISTLIQVLAKLTEHFSLFEDTKDESDLLALLEKELPRIAQGKNQIGIILAALADSMQYLKEETLQLKALNLLKENLSHSIITDSECADIFAKLVWSSHRLKSSELQLGVCNLLILHWPKNGIGPILYQIISGMRDLKTSDLQSKAFNFFEEKLSNEENLSNIQPQELAKISESLVQNSQYFELDRQLRAWKLIEKSWSKVPDNSIGPILYAIAVSIGDLKTADLQSRALNLLEGRKLSDFTGTEFEYILHILLLSNSSFKSNGVKLRVGNLCAKILHQALEKKDILLLKQLSGIVIQFTCFLIDNYEAAFSQKIEPNILELFKISIFYLSNEELPKVLKFWSGLLLNFPKKTGEPAPIFSLVEESIDQLPLSKRVFILQWVAQNLPDAKEANGPSMVAFIEQKLGSISGIPEWNTLGLLAKNLPNLDKKTQRQAIELLQKNMKNGQDFSFLQRAVNAFYKFVANFYPLNFDKILAFFLASFKMVWAFFANMSKLV